MQASIHTKEACTLHSAGCWNFCSGKTYSDSTFQERQRTVLLHRQKSFSEFWELVFSKEKLVSKLCPLINQRIAVQRGSRAGSHLLFLTAPTVWYQRGATVWEPITHEWNPEQQNAPDLPRSSHYFFLSQLLPCLPAPSFSQSSSAFLVAGWCVV